MFRNKGLCMLVLLRITCKSLKIVAFLIVITLFISGCSVNPATGQKEFTPLLPPSQEKKVGAEQHRNVVNEFGGLYNNSKLTNYVNKITQKIASVSELPADNFKVFVLNSPEVNAFALPGGYVYVTRGLVAIANTEAELAGVIGHEIGHVTARHAANRTNTQAISGIGAMLIGAITGSQQLAQVAQIGSQGLVASYSRSQEDEADRLGVRYLAKAGYNPYSQSDFLRTLKIYSDYEKSLSENGDQGSLPSFFSTHPNTASRVQNAREYATLSGVKGGFIGRDSHLSAVKGVMWGEDPSQGIVQGQSFIHSELGFTFSAPNTYRIINKPEAVYMQGQQGEIAKFDADFKASGQPPQEYLQYEFANNFSLSAIQSISVNGLNGATALTTINTDNGRKQARLFVFQGKPTQYYRFIMTAPPQIFTQKEDDFGQIIRSFRLIPPSEAKKVKTYYVDIRKLEPHDTLDSVSREIPDFNNKSMLLRVLNGFDVDEPFPNSGYIKIIFK